jgi:8-oxo-dGTP pyrophosphatase MutT (NUDIX family)
VSPAPDPAGHRLVPSAGLPAWLRPVVDRADGGRLPRWVRHATEPAPEGARRSAVLMLLADGPAGPDLLLTGRASTLRAHAGQPAFPGGALEPGEDAVAAALREGQEETGLDPDSVTPAAVLPALYLRPSGYVVSPVLAYWHHPGPVRPVDPAETAVVARVPLADLADPANRCSVVLRQDLRSPAFTVAGLVVWGFTAGLVDLLLDWGGWAVPWDHAITITAPSASPLPVEPAGSGGHRSAPGAVVAP